MCRVPGVCHAAVATLVLDSMSHVWYSSAVPVLPMSGVPSRGLPCAPVPPPFMTPWRAYAAVAAIFGSMTWVHVFAGGAISLPSESVTRSIALGSQ